MERSFMQSEVLAGLPAAGAEPPFLCFNGICEELCFYGIDLSFLLRQMNFSTDRWFPAKCQLQLNKNTI